MVQPSSSRLLLMPLLMPLRLNARGAGAARPEVTSCALGRTAWVRVRPCTRRWAPGRRQMGKVRAS